MTDTWDIAIPKALAKVSCGTTVAQLGKLSCRALVLSTDSANAGTIFVGVDNTVTNAGAGLVFAQLKATDPPLVIPASNANNLWVVGSAATQVLYVGAID